MLLLDTHMLLFALAGALKPSELSVLGGDTWTISAISLWEIAKLAELGRIHVNVDDPEFVRALSGLQVWPLSWAVARQSTALDFDGDPADQIIAATSLVHKLQLVTRDKAMRRSKLLKGHLN